MLETADFEASNIIKSVTGASITAVSGSGAALDKAKAGSYIFNLYKIGAVSAGKTTYTPVGQRSIVVSDAQTQPTVARKNDTTNLADVSNATARAAIAYDTLTVKFGDKEAKDGEKVTIVDAEIEKSSAVGTEKPSLYIKTVTVRVQNDDLKGYIELKKDVDLLINGSNK